MKYKPYTKVITSKDYYGVCAIYEPHPFRNNVIHSALKQSNKSSFQHTGIKDDEWCWVYYDWCANPVGLGNNMPEGEMVNKFTAEHFYGNQHLADYLNEEPANITT